MFNVVLATGPGEIASISPCAAGACVRALNLETGTRSEVAVPAGSSTMNGAFSPDGSFLVLQLSVGSPGDGGELGMQLNVASMTGDKLTPVPGTWVSSNTLIAFG